MLLNYETIKYFTNEQLELDGYDYSTRQYQVSRAVAARGSGCWGRGAAEGYVCMRVLEGERAG
jgi:ABC-type transport system involved in Fe-S cluster assembly fused permease/ATPase subunit